jgi:hypothetical protein
LVAVFVGYWDFGTVGDEVDCAAETEVCEIKRKGRGREKRSVGGEGGKRRTEKKRRTFFRHSKVERKVLLDIPRVVLELEQPTVKLRVERSEVVEVALSIDPLQNHPKRQSPALCALGARKEDAPSPKRSPQT